MIVIPTTTVEIQGGVEPRKLTMRLSPDLAELAASDDTFGWRVDKAQRKLLLEADARNPNRLTMWRSNEREKVGRIAVAKVFKRLGYSKEEQQSLIGKTFDAEVKRNKRIEIKF